MQYNLIKHNFLGGTKPEQYNSLPTPIVSRTGFQGCISSLETNGELIDPIRHALVPSHLVEEGCEGTVLKIDYGKFENSLYRSLF